MTKHEGMKAGSVARAAGVSVQTVRFYERKGLIDPPPRLPSGYRQYPAATVARIRFIRRAQELGFTLREIGELVALQDRPSAECADVRAVAEQKVHDVERRIADLARMKQALDALMDSCTGRSTVSECVILESLSGED